MINKIYEKIKNYIKENYKYLLFIGVLIFLFYFEFLYIISKSGGTIDLNERIEVGKDYTQNGNLKMSYVTAMKGTAPFLLLSYIIPDWDIYSLDEVTGGKSYSETLEIGKEYLDEGIDNAIIAAFNESNYNIEITKEIKKVIYISDKAVTTLKVGDEITRVDDLEINDIQELRKYVNTLKENDTVTIKVINKNEELERIARVYKDEDGLLKLGIAFHISYEYKTEIPVSIKMKDNESGSSGGLMMSLAIYNALTEDDITHGLNIVGTGSIKSDGVVEEIGGVKYKVLAAEKNKADIFFCPEENYEEAVEVKERRNLKVNIIKVNTLKDAITYLENYS